MIAPQHPYNEAVRLLALKRTHLLDTSPEERFDRFTRMAKLAFGVPIALVSLVDDKRQWFKSCQGLEARETPRDISFCGHAILSDRLFIVEDTHEDSRFADNPLVTGPPHIRFYAGAQLHSHDGYRLGTLCIIDTRPRTLDHDQRVLLEELARCVDEEINDFEASKSRQEQLEKTRILSALNNLTVDASAPLEQKIGMALDLGRQHLELETGIVSEITSEVYTIRWFRAPDNSPLEAGLSLPVAQTYCSLMLAKGDHLAISHMADSRYRNQSCYAQMGLESYIAAPIEFDGKLFGTLNFSSISPRSRPFTDLDRLFIVWLAQWMAALLQQHSHEDTLRKLSENVPGMLYQYHEEKDGHSRFLYCSEGIRDIYGLSPKDVEHDASAAFDTIHPDDLGSVEEAIHQSRKSLAVWDCQYRVSRPGEPWKWVQGRATPERRPDGSSIWHGFIADIDESKRAQLELQEREQQLRTFFELSPIGILLTDFRSGRNLDVNAALLNFTGYSYSQFIALNYWDVTPDDFETQTQQAISDLKEHGQFGPFEQEFVRKDGARIPILIQGVMIERIEGKPLIWSLVEDISERRKVDRMKNEFISTVSHELRTPLTSISGSLGLIAGGVFGALPDEVKTMVAIAARNSDQLRHLIDDLLDMEKLVSGKMELRMQSENISAIIQDSLDRVSTYAVDRQISLRLENQHPWAKAFIDARRLGQALDNLLSNAIKFSPQEAEVVIFTHLHNGLFRIEVTDYGTGIPEAFQPRIFEKFAQADSSDTRGRGGTGLGLAITREIMSQMGGGVGFKSTEGYGSTFWLDIKPDESADE
ncbi:ATP-binding protein [Marinobacter algicola]|uniref:histidine kinase n=1 Tax=Marinobacter algicola DG893 TaxID=443152 RepID=A6F4L6_9GAMM|nr:ATP-binding protein [Marinobacter algicola]EDM46292.1 Putative diguanylate cyclase (GGDEF domain) with GAF sensor domain [Marinobacter algicola DG893]